MGTYGQFSHSTGESATHLSSTLQGGQQSGGRPPTFPVCYKAAKNQEVDLLSECSYYRKPGSTPGAGSMVARGTRRVQVTRAAYGPPRGECRILTNSWSPSDRCDKD